MYPKEIGWRESPRTIDPGGTNALGENDWVEIEVAVDSGATETVMPEETLSGIIDITESAACKRER